MDELVEEVELIEEAEVELVELVEEGDEVKLVEEDEVPVAAGVDDAEGAEKKNAIGEATATTPTVEATNKAKKNPPKEPQV